jgi:small subunit ribosomal protein S4
MATTRSGARQLVSHKHITVNGSVVNIPSFSLKPGDIISVREKSKSLECITDSLSVNKELVEWLEWNPDNLNGKYLNLPERSQIPENIQEQLIVELYSK